MGGLEAAGSAGLADPHERASWTRSWSDLDTPAGCPSHLQGFTVQSVPTKPIEGQKTGTSGLRKKTKVFTSEHYLANWIQSLFNALGDEAKGTTIGLGGDGRYFNKDAAQIIIKLAAGNGVSKVVVGQDAIMATPAMSALIRRRNLYGARGGQLRVGRWSA